MEFTADVAGWINEVLAKDPRLPFSRAKCEQRGRGSLKRRDLTLLHRNGAVVLTGEIRLPYRHDGGSPYNEELVQDARKKAARAGVDFFFTWNVNECVLWQTFPPRTPHRDRNYKSWHVTVVHDPRHLEIPSTEHAVRTWLSVFLGQFASILRRSAAIGTLSPDEKFVDALESSLNLPILLNFEELEQRYQKDRFKTSLDKWMREEQGWIIYDDAEGIRDNLERAAKFASYALVNKLVFHEALLKRYGGKMDKITLPEHIDKGEDFRLHLERHFEEAKQVTRDYETVFGEKHTGVGNRIPFYSDKAVAHWRQLINQIHQFDFSRLDYEIIGSIFERLISPEERHKFGQFYTRVEVVDLINSFCIREGHEKVMDPACGGGTFLVRAYARKRELDPAGAHRDRLSDLFGVDVSHFATHLTTINLATRELIEEENYPQIVRNDFFDIKAHETFVSLPKRVRTRGLGAMQNREIEIPPLDAVIGNPPYLRQEDIPKAKKKAKGGVEHRTKEYYQQLVKHEAEADLSGRSDIHCYFWPHASSFLKDDGYLCFLSSSQWLDVEYGFRLQGWILRNFEIIAVFESIEEPWFVGARVATVVTILRRQENEAARMNNVVRFVQLRRALSEILAHNGTTAGAVEAADTFRDEILALTRDTVNDRYRARLVPQGKIWKDGVRLSVMMGSSKNGASQDQEIQDGEYYGGKWGVYLRAPDLWFELLDKYGSALVPLGDIAEVRFGVKSGCDRFFLPRDRTVECLNAYEEPVEFEFHYGAPRKEVKSGNVRLVLCGEERGEVRAIEAKYLEPAIHSLMEVDRFTVSPESCSNVIVLVGQARNSLSGSYALRYIRWGESQGYHHNPTCAARATQHHEWYDLTRYRRPVIVLPKIQQYRLIAFLNPQGMYQNSSLLGVYDVPRKFVKPLCGVLNSTPAILSRLVHARILGNEGNIQLDVYSAKMMAVPNLSSCKSSAILKRITSAFDRMLRRNVLSFLPERRMRQMAYWEAGKEDELKALSDQSELDMPDRRELDDAVLELIGVQPKKRREELIEQLYAYLREFFEWVRQKEEKAIANKKNAKRRGRASPSHIALQIYEEIKETEAGLLRQYDRDFLDSSKPFDTFEFPTEGVAKEDRTLFNEHGVCFTKGKKTVALVETKIAAQDSLVILLANSGVRGLVRVPHEEGECRRVLNSYQKFIQDRDRRIRELIEQRTADEDMQEKTHEALMRLVLNKK